jgi:WD40 repeat protein
MIFHDIMISQKTGLLAAIFLMGLLHFQKKQDIQKKPAFIWATEWSKDGKYIAVGGDDSIVWIYRGTDHSLFKSYKMNSMVKGLSWHPKENKLGVANMKGIQLLDMETGNITTVPGLSTGGRGIAWNYNGELLALADGYGVVQIMNRKGHIIRSIKKHNNNSYMTVDWHPSKNILVTGSDEIILFDTSGKQLALINQRKEHTSVLSAKWHPSGEFFATGDYGHEKEGMPTLLQFWKEDGTLVKEIRGHHYAEIRNLRWSNDGNFLATASDALRTWTKKGDLLYTGESDVNIWGIAWSKEDKQIITGSFENGSIKLWTDKAALIRKIN